MTGIKCDFCGEDCFDDKRKHTPRGNNDSSTGSYQTDDGKTACVFCMVRVCPECGNILEFIRTAVEIERGYMQCEHGPISGWGLLIGWDYRERQSQGALDKLHAYAKEVIAWKKRYESEDAKLNDVFSQEDLGYITGHWYMVEIKYQMFVPARFLGIRRHACGRNHRSKAKCPGEAVFENVKTMGCGFIGADWKEEGSQAQYQGMSSEYREVTVEENWALRAVEAFYGVLAGKPKSFDVVLNDGWHFVGSLKSPSPKENAPGEYYGEAVEPTGRERKGRFTYDGNHESPRAFLLKHLPAGTQIMVCKPVFKGLSKDGKGAQ